MQHERLDDLDRRIVGALQVDGRATWRRIADVLGEPVRTVSRRGTAMLDEGVVRVVGLAALAPSYLARVRCASEDGDAVARALAAGDDSVFVYLMAEADEVVAELLPRKAAADFVPELSRLDGVRTFRLAPVLHYFRTVAEWQPGLLTGVEARALELKGVPPEQNRPEEALDDADHAIIDALVRDGRTPFDVLGDICGFSEATARRRAEALVKRGVVRIRAVVEPAVLGLPLESLVWIDCAPADAMRIGQELASSPEVRYAALLLGRSAMVADVTTADTDGLRDLLTDERWTKGVQRTRFRLMSRAYKRGGVLTSSTRVDR